VRDYRDRLQLTVAPGHCPKCQGVAFNRRWLADRRKAELLAECRTFPVCTTLPSELRDNSHTRNSGAVGSTNLLMKGRRPRRRSHRRRFPKRLRAQRIRCHRRCCKLGLAAAPPSSARAMIRAGWEGFSSDKHGEVGSPQRSKTSSHVNVRGAACFRGKRFAGE